MENLNLEAILNKAVKEREAFIYKYPQIEPFQAIIDSHLKNQTGLNERFYSLVKATGIYKEKTGFKSYKPPITK